MTNFVSDMRQFAKIILAALFVAVTDVKAEEPWRFKMYCVEEDITLELDLYAETVEVPNMSMFGPLNGYIAGPGVYGTWMITTCKVESDKQATIHLSNDLGSETQTVRLELQTDSTLVFQQHGGVTIKKAVNRKLVKLPKTMHFAREKSKGN